MKTKPLIKFISAFLVFIMIMQILPLSVFANDKANTDALEKSVPETVVADISCEIIEDRSENSKTYLLEDGTYASIVTTTPIHEENSDGNWEEIVDIENANTVSEMQSNIQNGLAEIKDLNSVTADATKLKTQTIGTYISGLEDDELRIQKYAVSTTANAYSFAYIKLTDLNLPELGDDCIVTKAILNADCSKLSGSKNNMVTAQIVNDEWPKSNSTSHPVDDKVLDYNSIDSTNETEYEWDITEAACLWSQGLLDNNGIALAPFENNCKIRAYANSIVLYYEVIDELDDKFLTHDIDMGRAGTVHINDYTNDLYLVREELALDGNIMPVSITRTFNNSKNNELSSAGAGWHWNYVSTLTRIRSLNMYKWTLEDNSVIYFEQNSDGKWIEQGSNGDGYVLELGDDTNIISSQDSEYTYIFDNTSHKLITINDEHNNSTSLTYNDDYGLNTITDGIGRTYSFTSAILSNNRYINKIAVKDSNGTAVKLDGSNDVYLQYSYASVGSLANRYLSKVAYRDGKSVTYGYDSNGNINKITDIDGTYLTIEYNENGKVLSYTKYTSDGQHILDSCTFEASQAYQRMFTDIDGNITRQQYDANLNVISSIIGDEGYFFEYDELQQEKSISVREAHLNLLKNGDFENTDYGDADFGWETTFGASITEDTNPDYKDETQGSNVLMIESDYESSENAKQKYLFPEGIQHDDALYTVGVWAKVNSSKVKGDRAIKLQVNEYSKDPYEGEVVGEELGSITFDNAVTDWQYMMVTFPVKSDINGVQISLVCNNQIGDVLFDGVAFYKSTLSYVIADSIGCNCEGCMEPNCPCDCENEESCKHNYCKRGTTETYSDKGLITKEVITDGISSMEKTYSYDNPMYYLTNAINENGVPTDFSYDNSTGKLTSSNGINYTYNAIGLVKSITQTVTDVTNNSDKITLKTDYEYNGNAIKSITHNGIKYSYNYDVFGNITSVKVNSNELASYEYTEDGKNIGSITYANGDMLCYEYNENGNIVAAWDENINNNRDTIFAYEYIYDDKVLSRINDYTNEITIQYTDNGYDVYSLTINDNDGTAETGNMVYSYKETDDSKSFAYILNDTDSLSLDNQIQSTYKVETGYTTSTINSVVKNYENNIENTDETKVINNTIIDDYFGRTLSKNFGVEDDQLSTQYTYKTNGSNTTNQVATITHKYNKISYNYSYDYDAKGRIKAKKLDGEILVSYEYDEAGQLVRENNKELGETYVYVYDAGGNKVKTYSTKYTESSINFSDRNVSINDIISYDNEWKDKPITFNGEDVITDDLGNIVSYDGKFLSWNGRKLITAETNNSQFYHFNYNSNGLRSESIMSDEDGSNETMRISYIWRNDNQLAQQKLTISESIKFRDDHGHRLTINPGDYTTLLIYDNTGEAVGFVINDSGYNDVFYYVKDVTGQINSIISATDGKEVYKCQYDAWGYIWDEEITDARMAYCNPLLYKDYIFDRETKMYYLQSRYYEPQLARFISADDPMLTDTGNGTTLSTNMYSYCENDPVNNSDPTGNLSPKTWTIIGSAIVGGIYKVVDYLVHTAKNNRTIRNAVIAFVKGVIAGGVVGLIIAYGSNTTIRNAIIGAIGGVCSYTANALKNKSFKVNAFINAAFSGFVSGALASKLTSKIKSKNVQEITSTIVGGIAGGLMDW